MNDDAEIHALAKPSCREPEPEPERGGTKTLHLSFTIEVEVDTDESQVLDALLEGIPDIVDHLDSVGIGIDCLDLDDSEASATVREQGG